MHEYIRRLTDCGMRVDRAYTVVNGYYERLDFEGLEDFVKGFEIANKIINEFVD